jgi:drug/metabolite transporter (DMT)-like permease
MSEARPSRAAIVAAFAALYLVWGSTYWAIALVVRTMPPFFTGGFRFLVSGSLLFAWLKLRGVPTPAPREWASCAFIGTFLFVFGNGCVCSAERWVPSGETSLIVAGAPLWIAALSWLAGRSAAPRPLAWAGIALGLVGVAVLVWRPSVAAVGGHETLGRIILLVASLTWSIGAVASKILPLPSSAFMSSAAQMLTGGVAMTMASAVLGEPASLRGTAESWWALVYLILVGSLVGFASFTFLLRWVPATSVSTYAFVNPLVAVLMGAALLDERLGTRELLAGALILAAVAAILSPWATRRPAPEPRVAAE